MNKKFTFSTAKTKSNLYLPTNKINNNATDNVKYYYQICLFPNAKKLYNIRIFYIKEAKIINIIDKQINKEQVQKIYSVLGKHEYKLCSSYNFDNMTYPDDNDLLMFLSDNLNNNSQYSKYASF